MIFTETPITEYERSRNEEIMKNNRELERLGIKTLVPIVNNTSVERKGEDHEVSRSLRVVGRVRTVKMRRLLARYQVF